MELDWNKCIICQEEATEPLRCPLLGPGTNDNKVETYRLFLQNVDQFKAMNSLPTTIFFGDNESAESFAAHHASWHKSCHLKYNNFKLQRVKKKRESGADKSESRASKRRAVSVELCLFCERGSDAGGLHQVSTFDADCSIRTMINELQDSNLLAKIDGGDLIAKEIKYHSKCLVGLRNRYRSHNRVIGQQMQDSDEKWNESRAFVELTSHIEKAIDSGTLLFRLSELHSLYVKRLEDLGMKKSINKTRLKNDLLQHFPDSQEQQEGKCTIIVFKEGMKKMLKEALTKRDFTGDALILAKAALIVRNDILGHDGFKFTGSFQHNCQEHSLPSSLKLLVSLILNRPNLKEQELGCSESQACLTASQIIVYNVKKQPSSKSDAKSRHVLQREPPLPVYIGLNVHQLTRSKKLINYLFQMGLSISYNRVIELEEWIATSVCERFKEDGVVVPANLRKGLFTVGALDNIDHNPSSTTAAGAFHGCGISLFQFPTRTNPGESRLPIVIPPKAKEHCLPESYAVVPAVALASTTVSVPKNQNVAECFLTSCFSEEYSREEMWIEHALKLLMKDSLSCGDDLVWAAYHASKQPATEDPPAICALLPLFYEKAATPAMVKHGMDVQRLAIEHINPGQVPVSTFDQPLFALAKLVQWKWPTVYGESVHVVMLGGLHIEMALWNTLGDILEDSGWTSALTESEVASSGIADSFLKAAHLTRTRHAHQVSLLALHKLRKEAFLLSGSSASEVDWMKDMLKTCPTFRFWDLVMKYEMLILIFVRAHRDKTFPLYVEVLEKLAPLFFALDHVNYSRWLPVHIKDMKSLPESVRAEFEQECHWVLSKTNNKFSAIPIDQAHEQENAYVKGSGGCIGLTENPTAFRRWMLSGPEMARLQREFENEYLPCADSNHPRNFQNHEQGFSAQKTFQKQVNSLIETIKKMGNPFSDDFPELVKLDNRNCVHESVANDLCTLEETGMKQYQAYVKRVLEDHSVSIHEPIKRNSLALFKRPHVKITAKQGKKIKVLQNNVALFGQLYISMQSREGDLKQFFAHEIQQYPPSLSNFGKLHLPNTKSDLLQCLESPDEPDPPIMYDCLILDGAVIVHLLPIETVSTFAEYADKVFIPYVKKQLERATRVDVVWDTYVPDSLKESTREKRGKGIRRKVSGQTKLPGKWMDFLRDPENKKELFAFITSRVAKFTFQPGKAVYITSGKAVLSVGSGHPCMLECSHEEADTRIVVHMVHALQQGMRKIEVRTVDTDIIVILAGVYFKLATAYRLVDIWVAFGKGKKFKFYSINHICASLGEPKAQALPVFHALTGCDTTSAFRGKGKKSAWQAWKTYTEITETFVFLASNPFGILLDESIHFQRIQRFTVVLYDKTSCLGSVDDARKDLFCHKKQAMDKIPPTKNALLQHSQRAIFQAGIWTTSTEANPQIPSPHSFAWTTDEEAWVPVWMTIPEVSKACQELIRCCCRGDCSNCKCGRANLICSPLCKCKCND